MSAPRLRPSLSLVALALLLLIPSVPAQEGMSLRARFNVGMHVFRRCLFDLGFNPLSDFKDVNPANSIVIILGDPEPLGRFPKGLANFLNDGGSVMLATDWGTKEGDELYSATGVRVTGEILTQDKASLCYRGKDYRPFLVDGVRAASWLLRGKGQNDQQLRNVATDVTSRLRSDKDLEPLAYLPGNCRIEPEDPRELGEIRPRPQLFAVGGPVGKGRALVMADHSIFINALMIPQDRDTDNFAFTCNALTWLGHDDPNRTNVLLVIDGRVESQFYVPLKRPNLTPRQMEAAVTSLVDKALAKAERKGELGVFNQWLQDHLPLNRIVRWVVGILSVVLLLYLIYRFTLVAQHRQEAAVPLLARAVAQGRPDSALALQRQTALLKQGNLWEEARGLARRLFTSALGDPVVPAAMPRVAVRGNWWRRWSLRRQVEVLWQLARAEQPQPVGPRRWQRLLGRLDEVKAALADGTLSLHA
jgi:hypothetical protein